jgi:hypothetical protein
VRVCQIPPSRHEHNALRRKTQSIGKRPHYTDRECAVSIKPQNM